MTTISSMPETLTEHDFQAIVDLCFAMTGDTLQDMPAGETLPPVVLMGAKRNGDMVIKGAMMPPTLDGAADKDAVTLFMTSIVQTPAIDFVVLVAESWVVAHAKEHDPPQQSIANHPQRQEAVIFNIMSKDSQAVAVNWLHRYPLRLERGEMLTQMQGRMVRSKPPAH